MNYLDKARRLATYMDSRGVEMSDEHREFLISTVTSYQEVAAEEGKACQAILEIRGREKFLAGLKKEQEQAD